MSLSIPAISTETIYTMVTTDVDPTALPVAFAFTAALTDPVSGDWKSGSWDGAATLSGGKYRTKAEIRFGPGASTVTLTAGSSYDAWVRVIDDTPDGPTRKFDRIQAL